MEARMVCGAAHVPHTALNWWEGLWPPRVWS